MRFPSFLPTAFLTTASPSLTLTLTQPQTTNPNPNPNNSPDHNCSHLLVRDAVVRNAVGRKGGHRVMTVSSVGKNFWLISSERDSVQGNTTKNNLKTR